MDQRVDNEARPDSAPNRAAELAGGATTKTKSWRDTLGKRRALATAIAIGTAVALLAILLWWLHARNYESTDDAFIDTRTVQISAQVAAAIVDVPVTDNQLVEAGAELVRLDDRDYIAARDQEQASVANLKAQIVAQKAKIDQADKQAAQAQAALMFAQQENDRYQRLAKQDAATVEQAQQYASNLLQSQATFAAAQANAVATEKQDPVLEAQLKTSEAQLELAAANLSRTIIPRRSPGAWRISPPPRAATPPSARR